MSDDSTSTKPESATVDLAAIRAAEAELLELGVQVDRHWFPRTEKGLATGLLGVRGVTLFRGFVHGVEGPAPTSAYAAVRGIVEADISLQWLLVDPEVRVPLWEAERSRFALTVVRETSEHPGLAARWPMMRFEPGEREQHENALAEARTAAIAAGINEKGELPGLQAQARSLNLESAVEAYILAYRLLSGASHGAAVSFPVDRFEGTDATFRFREQVDLESHVPTRVLASSVFADLLCIVSLSAGLGIEEKADGVRLRFVPHAVPIRERLNRGRAGQ